MVFRLLELLFHGVRALFRSTSELAIENVALRQQLSTFVSEGRRPQVQLHDRLFWVALRRLWGRWTDLLVFVKPDTVVRWHREGFRKYWRWRSKSKTPGRPPLEARIANLVGKMAAENPDWGAPRIHGELLKLGLEVSERTVSRYMPKDRPKPETIESWKTFLRNHRPELAGMDFFAVPTATFRVLYGWFAIGHERRHILHFGVTDHPTAAWVIQQLRETFPFTTAVRRLVFDRDTIFSAQVVATVKSFELKPKRISFRSPWQNGVAERWIQTLRRELLDHVVVFNEEHLRTLLGEFVKYYHEDRTHLGLAKDAPTTRAVERPAADDAAVVSLPRVGGLHHRYTWRAPEGAWM